MRPTCDEVSPIFSNAAPPTSAPCGRLISWDPIAQKEVWKQEHVAPWNGGTLATAGNLVFQVTADGRFVPYTATSGAKLWESPTGTGLEAAPISQCAASSPCRSRWVGAACSA